ncbi:MAG: hypothetical protein JSU66_04950 [Deltaproteobacteria bacterium]|nr:MAG: hypothetical protein JSU66_04950 [Deltaproteobacteria bacterium]
MGAHTVTASVTDAGGAVGSSQITLTVNAVPVVTITAPPAGSVITEGDAVTLTGTATDVEDGDLSANLIWNSSLDGALGDGASLTLSDLSAGVHAITASAADSAGASGQGQVALRVNAVPVVAITEPAHGSQFTERDAVTLRTAASDFEDGNLSGAVTWVSDRDGALGTGAVVVRSDLSLGAHVITASVTDSDGVGSSDQITLTMNPNTPPLVTITSPPDGASVMADSVTLSGTAIDAEDGDLSASLTWSSSKDGLLGTGASLTAANLSFGSHAIEASVTDNKGATVTRTIFVKVKNPKSG